MESIGGADLHATVTGQNDRLAETEEEAFALVRDWLSYLPASCYAAARGPASSAAWFNPAEHLGAE